MEIIMYSDTNKGDAMQTYPIVQCTCTTASVCQLHDHLKVCTCTTAKKCKLHGGK